MQISPLSNFLVNFDNIADYVPVLSALTNLVDLFQRCVILPFMKEESIQKSHYFSHIKDKQILRCFVLILLQPVLGNIIIGYIDWKWKNSPTPPSQPISKRLEYSKNLLKELEENEEALKEAKYGLNDDKGFMQAAAERTVFALKYASDRLKNDQDFMLHNIEISAN